jgi:hypothetical protein
MLQASSAALAGGVGGGGHVDWWVRAGKGTWCTSWVRCCAVAPVAALRSQATLASGSEPTSYDLLGRKTKRDGRDIVGMSYSYCGSSLYLPETRHKCFKSQLNV